VHNSIYYVQTTLNHITTNMDHIGNAVYSLHYWQWPSPKTSADSSMLTSDIGCQHWIGRSLEMSPKMSIRLLRFGHKPRGHVLHSQTEARLCDQCETNKLSVDWWRSGAAVHAAATQRNTLTMQSDFILNITDDTK